MELRIFDLQLSVPATSLYLLLEAMTFYAPVVDLADARERWTTTMDEFDAALDELATHRVVFVRHERVCLQPPRDWLNRN